MMNGYFAPQEFTLGEVKTGSRTTAQYNRSQPGPAIRTVEPDCDSCTNCWWNDNSIWASYKAPNTLPEYYRDTQQRSMPVQKGIVVHYMDSTVEVLNFSATVTA